MDAALTVLFRWLHITFAAIAIGGVFFMRIVLPAGLAALDPAQREEVFLRCRRVFKMAIHTSILLLLVSGIYNSIRLFPQYKAYPPLLHVWGMHILVGLVIFGISIWMLMGRQAPAGHKTWSLVTLVLLLILVALGSSLKTARERHNPPAPPSAAGDTR